MKKVVIVGCGLRMLAFAKALKNNFSATHKIVALMDIDAGKMAGFLKKAELDVPVFTDFNTMCDAINPDLILVGTADYFHAEYIIKALDKKYL